MYSLFITLTGLIFSDLHIDKIRKTTFYIYLNYWQSKEIMTVRNLRIMFLQSLSVNGCRTNVAFIIRPKYK